MWRPVTLSGNRSSLMATSGLDRWPSKTELGLQTSLTILRIIRAGPTGLPFAFPLDFFCVFAYNINTVKSNHSKEGIL